MEVGQDQEGDAGGRRNYGRNCGRDCGTGSNGVADGMHESRHRDHAAAKSPSAVTAANTATATVTATRPPGPPSHIVGARTNLGSRRGCGQRTVHVDRGARGAKATREAHGHGLYFASPGVSRLRGLGVGVEGESRLRAAEPRMKREMMM